MFKFEILFVRGELREELMRVDKRVFVVPSTLRSNENISCMRVDESRDSRVFSTLVSWSNENKSCMLMGVEKRAFV